MNILVDDPCAEPGLWSIGTAFAAVTAAEAVCGVERISLHEASGRIAAADVLAGHALPRFDQSAMDGYGVHKVDVAAGRLGPFHLVGSVRAGGPALGGLAPGRVVRLLTGAVLPAGVGAVAMEERVDVRDGVVHLHRPAEAGRNIRRQGEDIDETAVVA